MDPDPFYYRDLKPRISASMEIVVPRYGLKLSVNIILLFFRKEKHFVSF
jgi:hypothetical protein